MNVMFPVANNPASTGAQLEASKALLVTHEERMNASRSRLAASDGRIQAGKVQLAISLERIRTSEERLRQSEALLRRDTRLWPISRLVGTTDLSR